LVKQIDDEVGRILSALEQRDMLKNTAVVFASDHGDYLGDHGLIGKGTFFEGSTHVPLMAVTPEGWDSQPGVTAGTICDDLVTLTDVTATLLELGNCPRPDYMDSRPLPELGLEELPSRDVITGFLDGAWMAFDGKWKLTKYAHGEAMLFDLAQDPQEQRNLIDDGGSASTYRHLDAALVDAMMGSIPDSHRDKMVYVRDLSADGDFGRAGWQRTYPQSWQP
jgi:arylsulfatase A-like enzyme